MGRALPERGVRGRFPWLERHSAAAAVCAVMTVGVAIAWSMNVGKPIRDAAIVAGLVASLAVGGHLVRQIAIALVRVKGRIEEISNTIEGELIDERV